MPAVREFNTDNFDAEVLSSGLPVLVSFNATWSGPCKTLSPIIAQLASEFDGKAKVGNLDIDASRSIAEKFAVGSVPTCLVFRTGQKVGQHIGLPTRDKLVKLLGISD